MPKAIKPKVKVKTSLPPRLTYLRGRITNSCPKCQGTLEVTMRPTSNECWINCSECSLYMIGTVEIGLDLLKLKRK